MRPPARLRRALRRLVQAAGYDLVWRDPRGYTLSTHVAAVLRDCSITTVVDVGAGAGAYGLMLRELGFAGRIISFEPLAASFTHLERRAAADASWDVERLALGDSDGVAELRVTRSPDASSLLVPTRAPQGKYAAALDVVATEHVEVRRLDAVLRRWLPRLEAERLFLKVDTQGSDVEVLRGAVGVLDGVEAMQIELSFIPSYDGAPSYIDALALVRELGFVPSAVYPVVHAEGLALAEADCVLVREPRS